MTIPEALRHGTALLADREIDAPRLESELLLAHLLSLKRFDLYLDRGRTLSPDQFRGFQALLTRRAAREPSQYILGTAAFCGLEIAVNPDVLIPRPETEVLAEIAWSRLAERSAPQTAMDFGTGSGCIAVAVAVHCPGAVITAIDRSPAALRIARENAERHGVADRIHLECTDGKDPRPDRPPFDVIATNPPYIPTAEIDTLSPEVREFEPGLALDGGADGLDFYRTLATNAHGWLKPGGYLVAEFGDDQGSRVASLFESGGWIALEHLPDLSGRPRILVARTPSP